MSEITSEELALSVVNRKVLRRGSLSEFTCSKHTRIGASLNVDWPLNDRAASVKDLHCEILIIEGRWCILDSCGETYLNGARTPISVGQKVVLQMHQEIRLGDIIIHVGKRPIVEIEPVNIDDVLPLLADIESTSIMPKVEYQELDPLIALDAAESSNQSHLANCGDQLLDDLIGRVKPGRNQCVSLTSQADTEFEINSSISLKTIPHQQPVEVSEDPLSDESLDAFFKGSSTQSHLKANPLVSGFGASLGIVYDETKLRNFSREVGETLQAYIKGVLSLNQKLVDGQFGPINRKLRPVNDNPLFMGLSYQDTVQIMFENSNNSVALKPSSAIAESLSLMRHHEIAMFQATSVALASLLESFSPDTLTRRFSRYKRNQNQVSEYNGEWAWEMYSEYYKEMCSPNQKGLEKLYWESFEQAYDRELRQLEAQSEH